MLRFFNQINNSVLKNKKHSFKELKIHMINKEFFKKVLKINIQADKFPKNPIINHKTNK